MIPFKLSVLQCAVISATFCCQGFILITRTTVLLQDVLGCSVWKMRASFPTCIHAVLASAVLGVELSAVVHTCPQGSCPAAWHWEWQLLLLQQPGGLSPLLFHLNGSPCTPGKNSLPLCLSESCPVFNSIKSRKSPCGNKVACFFLAGTL